VKNDDFFSRFQRTAWRLETLPAYGTPDSDPSFAAYLKLGHLPPLEDRPPKQAWMAAVRAAVAEGKQLGRVHVLRQPLTPYLAYELATYPENVAAGEDVRIGVVDDHPELAALDQDFWLLDDELVLVMDYDDAGRFIGLHPTRTPGVVDVCRRVKALAIARSVPLQEFLQPA
jgi:hypothetical protein